MAGDLDGQKAYLMKGSFIFSHYQLFLENCPAWFTGKWKVNSYH